MSDEHVYAYAFSRISDIEGMISSVRISLRKRERIIAIFAGLTSRRARCATIASALLLFSDRCWWRL
jgi:hypothetical protein